MINNFDKLVKTMEASKVKHGMEAPFSSESLRERGADLQESVRSKKPFVIKENDFKVTLKPLS